MLLYMYTHTHTHTQNPMTGAPPPSEKIYSPICSDFFLKKKSGVHVHSSDAQCVVTCWSPYKVTFFFLEYRFTVVTHSLPRPPHRTDFVRMRDKVYIYICIHTHTHVYICVYKYTYIYRYGYDTHTHTTHTHKHTHTHTHTQAGTVFECVLPSATTIQQDAAQVTYVYI
jgi:hypothetical protein